MNTDTLVPAYLLEYALSFSDEECKQFPNSQGKARP